MAFLTGSKYKIRFIYIYVRINCKRKKWDKKCMGKSAIRGGPTPNDKSHEKIPFFYPVLIGTFS